MVSEGIPGGAAVSKGTETSLHWVLHLDHPFWGHNLEIFCSWMKGDSRSREEWQQQPKFGKYICTFDVLLEVIAGKTGGILLLCPRKWRLVCMTNCPLTSSVEEAMSFPQTILFSLWSKMEVKQKTKLSVQFPIHSHQVCADGLNKKKYQSWDYRLSKGSAYFSTYWALCCSVTLVEWDY